MMDADRFGPRAMAWSEAHPDEIFAHVLGLEMALFIAIGLIENSFYAKHMSDSLTNWHRLLADVPRKRREGAADV